MVASDVSVGHEGVTGIVGFVVGYWGYILVLCFIIAMMWKFYSG